MQSTEFRDVPEDPRGAIWGFHFARPIFSFSGAMCWKTRLVLKTGAPEYLSSGALSQEPITCYPRRPRGSLSGRPGRSKSGKNWRRGQFLPDLLFPLFKVLSRGQFFPDLLRPAKLSLGLRGCGIPEHVKPPVGGHPGEQALLSAYGRCPLTRG